MRRFSASPADVFAAQSEGEYDLDTWARQGTFWMVFKCVPRVFGRLERFLRCSKASEDVLFESADACEAESSLNEKG